MTLSFEPRPFVPRNHDQFEVQADGLGRYSIDVSLPAHRANGAKYPVILAVDGNILFDIVQTAAHGRFVTMGGVLPPSILVGVGYPADEGMASFYGRRNYDFHGEWAMTDPVGKVLQGYYDLMNRAEGKPLEPIPAGGYPRFMAFLRDELLPALAEQYPIDLTARHTLIGDSSGGHFVLKALYDDGSPFKRYVCISPGFGSGDDAIKRDEAAYAATHADLDADLFICCGRVEIDEDPTRGMCRFGSGVTWVAEQFAIRQWPSARIVWEIMNNEDHSSIAPRAVAAGLRSVHRRLPGVHAEELRKAQAEMVEAMTRQRAEAVAS
jgi:predicted alpha/beta superfamily hydrolase